MKAYQYNRELRENGSPAEVGDCHAPNVSNFVSPVFERSGELGVWSVEEIGSDGEIYQAIFCGPDAESRCKEYRTFKYGG